MPANLGSTVTAALANLAAVSGTQTTFAARLLAALNATFGTANPFGTAATRNPGLAGGDVPILGADGKLDDSLIPGATDTIAGILRLAAGLSDETDGVVATAAQTDTLLNNPRNTSNVLSRSRVGIADMFANGATDYTTAGEGIILLSGGGGGGSSRMSFTNQFYVDDSRNPYPHGTALSVSNGSEGSAYEITYDGSMLRARGGLGAWQTYNYTETPGAGVFSFPTINHGAPSAPAAAIRLLAKGASGGRGGGGTTDTPSTDATSKAYEDVIPGQPGYNAELVIAFVDGSGKTFTKTTHVGTGGDGGTFYPGEAAATAHGGVELTADTHAQSAGERGDNGFALFIQLDN